MNHVTRCLFVVLATVILAACSQNQPQPTPIPDPDQDPPAIKVDLKAAQTFVNGKLSLEVDLEGEASTVDILKNSEVLATLKTPFSFVWDTTKEKEGTYTLQARVTQKDIFVSQPIIITIDRTAPSIEEVTSQATAPNQMYEHIEVVFSEPVLESSVNASTVSLTYADHTLPSRLELSADRRSLKIHPEAVSLVLPAVLTLSVKEIQDMAGNLLEDTTRVFEIQRPVDFEGSLNQDANKSAAHTLLAFDLSQNPVVFFAEEHPEELAANQLYVKRWTAEGWKMLGESINPVGSYAMPMQVVVSSEDQVVVAYTEYATLNDFIEAETPNVVIKRWSGKVWQQLNKFTDDGLGFHQLKLKPDGKHLLSLRQEDNLVLREWSGSAWVTQKTIPLQMNPVNEFAETYVYHTAIALDNTQYPVIAWFEYDYSAGLTGYLYVKRWNGNTWERLGQAVHSVKDAQWPDIYLKVDAENRPVILFSEVIDDSPTRQLYVRRWDHAWQTLGQGSLNINKSSEALLTGLEFDPQANPIVSWSEANKAYARILRPSGSELVGGSSLNQNTQNEATAIVYANTQGVYFKLLSEKIAGAFQLFVHPLP